MDLANLGGSMSAENSKEVSESQDVNNDGVVDPQQMTENSSPNEPDSKSSNKDYNWGQARKELKELQRQNLDLQNQMASLKPSTPEEEPEGEDEWLTRKEVKRMFAKEMRKRDMSTLDERVNLKYPDYYSVVTEDNLEELKNDSLATKIVNGLNDPFDRACFLYEQLKLRNGVSPSDKKQLEENFSKPRSTNSLGGTSPLHLANDYSQWPNKDIKKRLYEEMVQAAKGA